MKMKRLKTFYFLAVAFSFLFFVFSLNASFAQTAGCQEVPLPNLPGLAADPCSSPAAYIQYWFYFSLYLAGIAALLALVLAGAWRVFFATSPSSVSSSNKWVLNAVLGLILLFGSWLLLRTLGGEALTTLRDLQLPPLPTPGGNTIADGRQCDSSKPCPGGYTCLAYYQKCYDGTLGDPCQGEPAQGTCQSGLVCKIPSGKVLPECQTP